jgi:hypothetical protein
MPSMAERNQQPLDARGVLTEPHSYVDKFFEPLEYGDAHRHGAFRRVARLPV